MDSHIHTHTYSYDISDINIHIHIHVIQRGAPHIFTIDLDAI